MKDFYELLEDFDCTRNAAAALPYEFLKEHEVCKTIIDDAVNIWDEIGFLDTLKTETPFTSEEKEELSVAYTNLAYACLSDDYRVEDIKLYFYDKYSDAIDFEIIAFPILRKVLTSVDNFSFDNFLEFFAIAKYYTIDEEIEDYLYNEDFDYEAELCALLAEVIIANFNNIKED